MKKLYFSLLAAILPMIAFAQIPSNDMESWRTTIAIGTPSIGHTPVLVESPYQWYGSDSTMIALGQTLGSLAGADDTDWRRQIFKESTIVHGGSSSAKIMTRKEWTFTIPGVLANAIPQVGFSAFPTPTVTAVSLKGGSPVSAKPTTVTAWVQFFPGKDAITGMTGIDSGSLAVQVLGQVAGKDSVIGTGYVIIPPTSSWLQVTCNINYTLSTVAVDTFRISLSSGKAQSGLDSSTLYVDDLAMTTIPNPDHSAVSTVVGEQVANVYPNPATGVLYIDVQRPDLTCKLVNVNGQTVATKALKSNDKIDINHLAPGLYMYVIEDSAGTIIQKDKLIIGK